MSNGTTQLFTSTESNCRAIVDTRDFRVKSRLTACTWFWDLKKTLEQGLFTVPRAGIVIEYVG
jgi:hypothetical protein